MEKSLAGEGHALQFASDADTVMSTVKSQAIRVALIDWTIHSIDAAELCKRIRSLRKSRHVYVIALCPASSMGEVIGALNAGADDYLATPFTTPELVSRVRVAQRMLFTYDRIVESQKKLLRLTREDPLTGLHNRRALFDELLAELNRAIREAAPLTLLLVDIGGFPTARDAEETEGRDAVLKEIAERLVKTCRPYDTIGRYDGEQFLAILPHTRREDAETISVRIRDALSGLPYSVGGERLGIEFGFGLLSYQPETVRMSRSEVESVLAMMIKKVSDAAIEARSGGPDRIVSR